MHPKIIGLDQQGYIKSIYWIEHSSNTTHIDYTDFLEVGSAFALLGFKKAINTVSLYFKIIVVPKFVFKDILLNDKDIIQ